MLSESLRNQGLFLWAKTKRGSFSEKSISKLCGSGNGAFAIAKSDIPFWIWYICSLTGAALRFAEIMSEKNLSGGLILMFYFVIFASGLSEISSNTAAAAITIPVIMSITLGLELNVIPYLLISIVAFNSAYILPVSIRAIPVGYGFDPCQLFRHGSRLAIFSIVTISVIGYIFMNTWSIFSTL